MARFLHRLIKSGNADFDNASLLLKRCNTTMEEIKVVLDGDFFHLQAGKSRLILLHLNYLSAIKDTLEEFILDLSEPFMHLVSLLMSVLGMVNPFTVIRVLAEIGQSIGCENWPVI